MPQNDPKRKERQPENTTVVPKKVVDNVDTCNSFV
jgi:hypothetical protein